MKRLSILIMLSWLVSMTWSCKKEENRIYLESNETPVLTISNTAPELRPQDSLKQAVKFSWTNPEFRFTTGVSSQDINYVLEVDKAGANFNSPDKASLGIAKDMSRTFEVRELNDLLLVLLKLPHSEEHNLEARVKATIGTSTASVYSNAVAFKATPYPIPPKVAPPATGELYIVGSATPGGWNNPVPVPDQQFTQVSETLYEITINLVGGGAYLLLPENGSWAKYAVNDDTIPGLSEGGDFFREGGKDIPAPAAAGTYKITVDFQRGRFSVVKQ
ncbi:MAG TPA: SusE domain-containing protein [Flavihumibacter sp.]|jgi:hypothetical protein